MTLTDYTTTLVTNEMWVGQGSYWVEAGIYVGTTYPSGHISSPSFFWADNRPNGTFNMFPVSGFTFNHPYYFNISYLSGTNWEVNINDTPGSFWYSHTSVSDWSGPARFLTVGNETSSDTVHTYGSGNDLEYESLQNAWIDGWHSAGSGGAVIDSKDAPLYMNYQTIYVWERSGAGATC